MRWRTRLSTRSLRASPPDAERSWVCGGGGYGCPLSWALHSVEPYHAWGGGVTLSPWTDVQGWQEENFSMTKVPGTIEGGSRACAGA